MSDAGDADEAREKSEARQRGDSLRAAFGSVAPRNLFRGVAPARVSLAETAS
jgi:hypothetical protein